MTRVCLQCSRPLKPKDRAGLCFPCTRRATQFKKFLCGDLRQIDNAAAFLTDPTPPAEILRIATGVRA